MVVVVVLWLVSKVNHIIPEGRWYFTLLWLISKVNHNIPEGRWYFTQIPEGQCYTVIPTGKCFTVFSCSFDVYVY